ncbi:MAG: hypothetical protein AAB538_05880 [Patescibacteria group bacterium]
MSRGLTIILSWLVALGLIALALVFGEGAKNVRAQMMPPGPTPTATMAVERGACFVPDIIGCRNGETRKACEKDLGGSFFAGGVCPEEKYSECNRGHVIYDGEGRLDIGSCDTKTDLEIFREYQEWFNARMVRRCAEFDTPGQCRFDGTYFGPRVKDIDISEDGKTCTIQVEAWYRCVRTY